MTQERKFPPIILDTTLHDLLTQDSRAEEALCNVKPTAEPEYKVVPLNRKHLITSTQSGDGDDLAHLQLENVSYLLSFWAGCTDIILIASEGFSDDETLSREGIERNAIQSFHVLEERQRPRPKVFKNLEDFITSYGSTGRPIRWGFATDFAEGVPSVLHPEAMYKINSKRWLAECDLLSANDQIIDCECSCSMHATKNGQWFYGTDCSQCTSAIEKEFTRVQEMLETREPPYVLKLTQSLGSVGTTLVKTKEEGDDCAKQTAEVLRQSLPRLTAENAHVYPTSLVLSDFLPGDTIALNFFIRGDGSPLFLGACHQLSTRGGDGGRQQTALTWSDQEKLEKKYAATLDKIRHVLHKEGYYGPAGADIMETEDSTQYVIDLNVRTSTSMILGLLKGHCEKRHFDACLVFECLLLEVSRDGLEKEFEVEFEQGQIILLGTTTFGKKNVWAYPIVLASETQEDVKALSERILKFEAGGVGDAREAGSA